MSAIASMTLNDGTADHVFTPIQANPPTYRNLADAEVPDIGQEEVVVTVIRAKGNGVHRVRVTTKTPFLEAQSESSASGYVAAPAVAYAITAVTDYYIPQRSSPAQRLIVRNLHRNLMNNAQAIDAIEQLVAPY
jgi:hypothetical protein